MTKWHYGSVWWKLPEKMVYYTEEHLKQWSDREIMKMHYYLTMRLDGYGHLDADESIKHNCNLFRRVLAGRGIDGVDNVIWNETFYGWGYRDWQFTSSRIDTPAKQPDTKFVRIGL